MFWLDLPSKRYNSQSSWKRQINPSLLFQTSSALFLSSSYNSFSNSPQKGLVVEQKLYNRGYRYILGSDESGRGALAGPVVAATCCIINPQGKNNEHFQLIEGVADSKLLTKSQRNEIFTQLMNQPLNYAWTVAQRSSSNISETNILKATMECFQESIQNLVLNYNLPLDESYSIVDGNKTPKLKGGPTPIPCRPYVKGDVSVYTIALASIIAKVTRDDIMIKAHEEYPQYHFDLNKGYSTSEHIEAIHKYGPCPLHRKSFKPLIGR